MISIWSADCDLISNLKAVEIIGKGSAFFYAEFLIILYSRRRSNGKHTFTDAWCTDHGTLSWHMLEKLSTLRSFHTEGFYIRCLLTDICDHANLGDQRIQCIIFMTGTFTHSFHLPVFQRP